MKNLLLASTFILAAAFVNAQEATKAPGTQAEISFEQTTHDFGTVAQGSPTAHEFKFTNTSKVPLVLQSVNASCGCTTPEWPKEPIMPGKSAFVKAVYDSNRIGTFTKSITVNSNASNGTVILTIKGNIEAKPAEPVSPVVVPQK